MLLSKNKSKQHSNIIGSFIHSTVGQFIIGGLTVAGIAYFGNHATNPAVAGLIGALPVGMPSSVFVDDTKVESYAYNLMMMSIPLILATILNWYLIAKMKFTKYKSVGMSMLLFVVIGGIITLAA
uniref:Uncharacterized protein n=1 Tax=viral metagenome TaxID=1070528 RepID=A0A6C0C6C6_9ZZZZ